MQNNQTRRAERATASSRLQQLYLTDLPDRHSSKEKRLALHRAHVKAASTAYSKAGVILWRVPGLSILVNYSLWARAIIKRGANLRHATTGAIFLFTGEVLSKFQRLFDFRD